MAIAPGFSVLAQERIQGTFQGLLDQRTLPPTLIWSARVPEVPAADEEIMASYYGLVKVADLIADDQRAMAYSTGKFQFEATAIPNLKVGQKLNQAMINQLINIQANPGYTDSLGLFTTQQTNVLLNIRRGIAIRKETLIVGMLEDAFAYNKLGVILDGATWGMPSDLKITVSTAWSDATNGKPVTDIFAAKLRARVKYGIELDRMTISTPGFQEMIATTEFQNQARMYLAPNVSFTNLNQADLSYFQGLAETVLKLKSIEFNDGRYWDQDMSGTWRLKPIQDLDAVILSAIANDGDATAWDFANGIVTESVVSQIIGGPLQGGPQRGPVAYVTGDESLNPPNVEYWGVQRGFPRKHLKPVNACLRIGTVTDTITADLPY